MEKHSDPDWWQTKPTDRFVLRWIKKNLSARITPSLLRVSWLRPWMITLCSSGLGIAAGAAFATRHPFTAGLIAACSQVLDGVDGQFARISGRQSKGGAFWDSVLDRYADGALMVGLIIYLVRLPFPLPAWLLLVLGFLALTGANLISYSTSRAEALGIDLGKPTLASKGTRSAAMIATALGSPLWAGLPGLALIYLSFHPNLVVARRLLRTLHRAPDRPGETVDALGVIHGRFQILHNDHLKYLLAGKARCRHLVIGITNPDPTLTRDDPADPARSKPGANPLTYFERHSLVTAVLGDAGLSRSEFSVVPFPINFPDLYGSYVPLDAVFYLTVYDQWGRRKQEMFQRLGLKVEVLWTRDIRHKGLSAGEIRRKMASGGEWEPYVPKSAADMMKQWKIPERLRDFYPAKATAGKVVPGDRGGERG